MVVLLAALLMNVTVGQAGEPLFCEGVSPGIGSRVDDTALERVVLATADDLAEIKGGPRIVCDAVGKVHIVFFRVEGAGSDDRVGHVTSGDGGYDWTLQSWPPQQDETPSSFILGERGGVAFKSHRQVHFVEFDDDSSVRVDRSDQSFYPTVAGDEALLLAWAERGDTTSYCVVARSESRHQWSSPDTIASELYDVLPVSGPAIATDGAYFYLAIVFSDGTSGVFRSPCSPQTAPWERLTFPSVLPGWFRHKHTIAVGASGRIGVMYGQHPNGPGVELWFTESTDRGLTWSDPVLVSSGLPGNHYDPVLAASLLGTWHAAWLLNSFGSLTVDVLYGSYDSEWSTPLMVNDITGNVLANLPATATVAVDPDGEVYVAWPRTGLVSPDDRTEIYVSTTRDIPIRRPPTVSLVALPNPLRGAGTLRLRTAFPGIATVRVFDIHGRIVRRYEDVRVPLDRAELLWDGRMENGHEAPNGVYFIESRVVGSTILEGWGRFVFMR